MVSPSSMEASVHASLAGVYISVPTCVCVRVCVFVCVWECACGCGCVRACAITHRCVLVLGMHAALRDTMANETALLERQHQLVLQTQGHQLVLQTQGRKFSRHKHLLECRSKHGQAPAEQLPVCHHGCHSGAVHLQGLFRRHGGHCEAGGACPYLPGKLSYLLCPFLICPQRRNA